MPFVSKLTPNGRRWLGAAGAIALIAGLALATRPASGPAARVADSTSDERIGTEAPDVTLASLTGENVALTSLRGKVVAVDFWATYCGPCVRTMPHLQELDDALADDDFALYSINVDPQSSDRNEMVQEFLERQGLRFPVVFDTGRATWLYRADRIPLLVVLDRDGIIRHVFRGFVEPRQIETAIRETIALPRATGVPSPTK